MQQNNILSVTLVNRSSHCYANSSMLALMWSMSSDPPASASCPSEAGALQDARLGRGNSCIELWKIKPWTRSLDGWERPHMQHDVGEFLQFLGNIMCDASALGSWTALQDSVEVGPFPTDRGNFWPLLLPASLPDSLTPGLESTTLQRLVILWRNQASRHAASNEASLPALFPLQVNRFDADGNKLHTPIKPSAAVYIPFYTSEGLHTASCRYRLAAIIFHIGATKLQGHYRTALQRNGSLQFVTDDNTSAVPMTADVERLVYQNSYIFLLKKCQRH